MASESEMDLYAVLTVTAAHVAAQAAAIAPAASAPLAAAAAAAAAVAAAAADPAAAPAPASAVASAPAPPCLQIDEKERLTKFFWVDGQSKNDFAYQTRNGLFQNLYLEALTQLREKELIEDYESRQTKPALLVANIQNKDVFVANVAFLISLLLM
ncbi:uncharacterized protein LOC121995502 [Zingiber officinale]|uniref:uncharacterized protein LOC121995502 n=1 Tax=Zingiber officinale TaxID=94328 RepID=UPI001C4B319F|nr:uncharacterized protein LOC121995502 [Zingiber officinale]